MSNTQPTGGELISNDELERRLGMRPADQQGPYHQPKRMSSAEILKLIDLDPAAGAKGALVAAKQQLKDRTPEHYDAHRFLDDLIDQTEKAPPAPEEFVHPAKTTGPRRPLREGEKEYPAFERGDYRFLDSLPENPADLDPEDLKHLLRLEAEARGGSSDARLVAKAIGPIRKHWDRQEVAAELAAHDAKDSFSTPICAVELIADALARELPTQFTLAEREIRAYRMIDDARQARQNRWTEEREQIYRRLQAI